MSSHQTRGVSEVAVPGYGYLTFLVPEVLEVLGGIDCMASAPVELVRSVMTRGGQECVVAVLAKAPSDVDDERLRQWKEFLLPVLQTESPALRQKLFENYGLPPDDPQAQLPPMILAEDWPDIGQYEQND